MSARIWDGTVHEGKLLLCDPDGFREYFKQYEGRAIQLSIEPMRRTRSTEQNAYYWGVVLPTICKSIGADKYDKNDIHESLKARFLSRHKDEIAPGLPLVRSTATLDTREFGEYLDAVIQLAAEMGIEVPEAALTK